MDFVLVPPAFQRAGVPSDEIGSTLTFPDDQESGRSWIFLKKKQNLKLSWVTLLKLMMIDGDGDDDIEDINHDEDAWAMATVTIRFVNTLAYMSGRMSYVSNNDF
ncbi:hypothetical protein V8E54_005841 [Elaphomyces granulatus]